MLQSLSLLEASAGPRLLSGCTNGVLALLQRASLMQPGLSEAFRTLLSTGPSNNNSADFDPVRLLQPSSADAAPGTLPDCEPSSSYGAEALHRVVSGLRRPLAVPQWPEQQQRAFVTSSGSFAIFGSNLTRPSKAKVLNRDNFQRWRDSGRDVRVVRDILDEAPPGGQGAGGGGGRSGGGGARRGRGSGPLAELKAVVVECRDLRELQVVVRECGRDMDAAIVCIALSRLSKLKQATPAAASPSILARRLAESLMLRLQDVIDAASLSGLSSALHALAEVGVLPGRPLMEALADRLTAPSPRGNPAVVEADPRVVSSLLLSAAKFRGLQARQGGPGPGPGPGQALVSASGSAPEVSSGARETAGDDGAQQQLQQGDVLRDRLWPAVRFAAEAKLLRALGEEPEGVAAAPVGGEDGPEVDDSLPQSALRAICKALALAHETHSGAWTAAVRLAARHAKELQPAVAASVLRSYAVAGGPLLYGGSGVEDPRLAAAVWRQVQSRLTVLDVGVLLDLTFAAAKLAVAEAHAAPPAAAAAPAAAGGEAAEGVAGESAEAVASAALAAARAAGPSAAEILPPLCAALTPRVPSLSCADVAVLATGLAEAHRRLGTAASVSEQRPQTPQRHAFGDLPRLLGELLLLRGPSEFGASNFSSIALALALLGHTDRGFWRAVEAAVTPEVPCMDGRELSKLLGGLHTAGIAASAAAAAASAPATEPQPLAAAARPSEALLVAVYDRTAALTGGPSPAPQGSDSRQGRQLGGKEAFHILRCLAEWRLADDSEAGAAMETLRRLADRLVEAEAAEATGRGPVSTAPPPVRQRLSAALRDAGLGEHPLTAQLVPVGP